MELQIRGVSKTYSNGVQALKDVTLMIPPGMYGLLGPNGAAEEGSDELSRPLYVKQHRVRSGDRTITVSVAREPALAGLDPYRLLDWESGGGADNLRRVEAGR